MVWVQTGTQNDSGTSETVCLVLCGLKGESEPVHVNAKDGLNPGSFIRLEVSVKEYRFIIFHLCGCSWVVQRILLLFASKQPTNMVLSCQPRVTVTSYFVYNCK